MVSFVPQVPDVDVSVPDVSADASVPSVGVDVPSFGKGVPGSLPGISGDMGKPSGLIGVNMPSVEGGISGDLPSIDTKLTTPDVVVEGGDASLTAGLAASAAAGVGAIGAGIALIGKGNKPKEEVRFALYMACIRLCSVYLVAIPTECWLFFSSGEFQYWFWLLLFLSSKKHELQDSLDGLQKLVLIPDGTLNAALPSANADANVAVPGYLPWIRRPKMKHLSNVLSSSIKNIKAGNPIGLFPLFIISCKTVQLLYIF